MSEEERDTPIGEDADPDAAREGETVATEDRDLSTPPTERDVEAELETLRDRHLRLQAEFDNYRKREARERAAAWGRAKADLIQKLLGAIDDLRRVARLEPEETSAAAVIEGVDLVERNVFEILEREGLSTVGEIGEPFDPNLHEAIAVLPAPTAEDDGTVADVASIGYRFGRQLLRPARVQVYRSQEDASGGAPE